VVARVDFIQNLSLVGKWRRGGKKGGLGGVKKARRKNQVLQIREERPKSCEMFQVPQDGPLCISVS